MHVQYVMHEVCAIAAMQLTVFQHSVGKGYWHWSAQQVNNSAWQKQMYLVALQHLVHLTKSQRNKGD